MSASSNPDRDTDRHREAGMDRPQIGYDTWTYYEFGARSFQDDIRALIINYLDQTVYREAVSTDLREQASARPLPFVPISLERVTLESEPIDPHRIGSVPSLRLHVQLDEQDQTVAGLLRFPELVTKIRDRVAREIATDLIEGIFSSSYSDGVLSLPTPLSKGV